MSFSSLWRLSFFTSTRYSVFAEVMNTVEKWKSLEGAERHSIGCSFTCWIRIWTRLFDFRSKKIEKGSKSCENRSKISFWGFQYLRSGLRNQDSKKFWLRRAIDKMSGLLNPCTKIEIFLLLQLKQNIFSKKTFTKPSKFKKKYFFFAIVQRPLASSF